MHIMRAAPAPYVNMPNSLSKTVRHLARLFLPRPMAALVDITGHHVIVTGASPGSLGYETARILAGWGARVVATCVRNVPLMEATLRDDLRKRGAGEDNVTTYRLDLSDPDSVNGFAAWYRDRHQGRLHVLVNNAGIHRKTLAPRKQPPLAEDGFEIHWRTNYLGAFHLTWVLLPLLQRTGLQSGDARVVNVSSGLHERVGNEDLFDEGPRHDGPYHEGPRQGKPCHGASRHGEPLHGEPRHDGPRYHSWDAYGRSKLAMIHMAFEIERRFAESHNLHAMAVHPGVVMTNLTLPQAVRGRIGKALHRISSALASQVLLSPNAGAQTIVMCASTKSIQGGQYYERCAIGEPSADCHDADASKRLWDQSEQWVGTLPELAPTGGNTRGHI